MSFTACTLLGITVMTCLNLFSRRTIKTMKLFRTGDFVEVTFFNAFWVFVFYKTREKK